MPDDSRTCSSSHCCKPAPPPPPFAVPAGRKPPLPVPARGGPHWDAGKCEHDRVSPECRRTPPFARARAESEGLTTLLTRHKAAVRPNLRLLLPREAVLAVRTRVLRLRLLAEERHHAVLTSARLIRRADGPGIAGAHRRAGAAVARDALHRLILLWEITLRLTDVVPGATRAVESSGGWTSAELLAEHRHALRAAEGSGATAIRSGADRLNRLPRADRLATSARAAMRAHDRVERRVSRCALTCARRSAGDEALLEGRSAWNAVLLLAQMPSASLSGVCAVIEGALLCLVVLSLQVIRRSSAIATRTSARPGELTRSFWYAFAFNLCVSCRSWFLRFCISRSCSVPGSLVLSVAAVEWRQNSLSNRTGQSLLQHCKSSNISPSSRDVLIRSGIRETRG